ncbi:hypothetical protein UY3_14131 [Chelonia mydas]|uniref:Uncharacterized protein n=1 Tax=Chelonia mydas TaxID=8469 RepID=M7B020_CHEMY|nr:hypothetical protein UY3_14131 [Chelonia mydas]
MGNQDPETDSSLEQWGEANAPDMEAKANGPIFKELSSFFKIKGANKCKDLCKSQMEQILEFEVLSLSAEQEHFTLACSCSPGKRQGSSCLSSSPEKSLSSGNELTLLQHGKETFGSIQWLSATTSRQMTHNNKDMQFTMLLLE